MVYSEAMLDRAPAGPQLLSDPPLADPMSAPSHGGLADVDPWLHAPVARRRSLPRFLGMGAASEVLEVIALALLMFVAVRFVVQNFVVDGASMRPMFAHGDLLIVNKLAYRTFDVSWLPWSDDDQWQPFGDPAPGDVVVFHFSNNRDFIKRVVGVPGQTVEVRDGLLRVDGAVIDEPYVETPARYEFGPQVVPAGMMFVLGDNRNNSFDSHSWGMLARDQIVGRAELRYWPLGEFGRVSQREGAAGPPLSGARSLP